MIDWELQAKKYAGEVVTLQQRLSGLEIELTHRHDEIETLTSRIEELDQNLTQVTNEAATNAARATAEAAAITASATVVAEELSELETMHARRKEELRAMHRRCGKGSSDLTPSSDIILSSDVIPSYCIQSHLLQHRISSVHYLQSCNLRSLLRDASIITTSYFKTFSCIHPPHIISMHFPHLHILFSVPYFLY